jgi:hypothetical protein
VTGASATSPALGAVAVGAKEYAFSAYVTFWTYEYVDCGWYSGWDVFAHATRSDATRQDA